MPRNGSGGYSLPSGNPVVTGTTIDSAAFNNTMTDIGTAIAGSLSADGQTAWAGNQNANNNRLTALGAASALTDAVSASDTQNGRLTFLTGVAGTNTITATVVFLAAYTAGEVFRFVAAGANTGAVTLNVNSLGAKSVVRPDGSALIAGEIASGAVVTVVYDGTNFQIPGLSLGRLIGVQVIGATGTYTPTAGTNSVVVEVVGGGGAGGGANATAAGQFAGGGGGGGGGYSKARFTAGFSGVTVTIGAGGVGVAGGTGGNGGTTSFGALLSGTGGGGAAASGVVASGTSTVSGGGSAGGGSASISVPGTPGGVVLFITPTPISGAGGASFFGPGGGIVTNSANGTSAPSFGGGGGGASNLASQSARAGGSGGGGVCIVWEYA